MIDRVKGIGTELVIAVSKPVWVKRFR